MKPITANTAVKKNMNARWRSEKYMMLLMNLFMNYDLTPIPQRGVMEDIIMNDKMNYELRLLTFDFRLSTLN